MISNQQHIQELAYYLWLSEGKPEGQSDKHWQIAISMAEKENDHPHQKRSVDPSEAKGSTEPEQPDQT
ncbi:DUF2934 domain-containing protein [Cellvibrio mixtus]|uniref:DUF2934 domain-containing protein n=1 Tax=Cellvibrio mixtus TaxID=39650 RepID=UPI000586F308|nr:DUF2934 domain-containing protein [Cellvibrio mixtus]